MTPVTLLVMEMMAMMIPIDDAADYDNEEEEDDDDDAFTASAHNLLM